MTRPNGVTATQPAPIAIDSSSVRAYAPEFLDFLSQLRFSGEISALPEGTVAFPHEPLLRVTAPIGAVDYRLGLEVAGLFWIGGFALFQLVKVWHPGIATLPSGTSSCQPYSFGPRRSWLFMHWSQVRAWPV